MEPGVRRTRHEVGRHAGRTTLAHTFSFEGLAASALREVLRSAPLVGTDSIFGDRPGSEHEVTAAGGGSGAGSRSLVGFSPVPGFRFDVELTEPEAGVFIASFSQSHRRTPYLEGDALWLLSDGPDGSLFEEEINTERALAAGAATLTGPRPSLRRWMFFRVGHGRVMSDATSRMAHLAH